MHVLIVGAGLHIPPVLGHLRQLRPGVVTTLLAPLALLPRIHDAAVHDAVVGLPDDAPSERWVTYAESVQATRPVDRVLCLDDGFVALAADIAAALGVRWHSAETVRWVRDKDAFRRRLADTGVENVAHAEVTGPDDITAFGEEAGWPVLVKPVSGTGSVGINVIAGPHGVRESWENTVATGAIRVVAEELLPGQQYSLDAVSVDGEHRFLPLVRKFSEPRRMVEVGHLAPAPVSDADRQACMEHVGRILDAVGVLDGPSSTELVLTDSGPRAIETHLRPSGGEIPSLMEYAVGTDVYEAVARAVVGDPLTPDAEPLDPRWAALWHAFPDVDGVVREIEGLEDVRAAPGVVEAEAFAEVGGPAGRLTDNGQRLAVVIATADAPDLAVERARNGAESIEFVVAVHGAVDSVW